MGLIKKIEVSTGIYWVEVPEIELYILCGCPSDSVKHLMKRGLIQTMEKHGVVCESGPNAILLSDIMIQMGEFANMGEFPVLQMFYKQGMIIPNHPNNKGNKPILIGSKEQLEAQINYIYRGNYGLTSIDELIEAGVDPDLAKEYFEIKLKFAFGKISNPRDLFEKVTVGTDTIEIKNGLFIKRKAINIFEFIYKNETVKVDLNIKEKYKAPYKLGFYNSRREYFSIIHSGQGDGWDVKGPCMSSILMFQGRIYLIDTGPNTYYSLTALGIGIKEIDGIFHTHGHDDHFSGIASLIMGDHKMKYFATPEVRLSVMKKLSALLSIDEMSFYDFFDVQDLKMDEWNSINGMDVMPLYSPHPVETTIFLFRALGENGYKTYGHYADISSLSVFEKMIKTENTNGISREMYFNVKQYYLKPLSLKKIDVGGGMIHGEVKDFIEDQSDKIVLAHTSSDFMASQKAVGSDAEFGSIDILIESKIDYIQKYALEILNSYFSKVPMNQINLLLNNNIVTFNPGTIIMKRGDRARFVYLTLTGIVESILPEETKTNLLSEGSFLGEISSFTNLPINITFRAVSYVRALEIPISIFSIFVKNNGLLEKIERTKDQIEFLHTTWLLGDNISFLVQNQIATKMKYNQFPVGHVFSEKDNDTLYIISKGTLICKLGDDFIEELNRGDCFGEEKVIFNTFSLFRYEVAEQLEVWALEGESIKQIPIVHWKLLERFELRKKKIVQLTSNKISPFYWRPEYSINIVEMDNHHKKLFELAENLYQITKNNNQKELIKKGVSDLLEYTIFHFNAEEELLKKHKYPLLEDHNKKHKHLIQRVLNFSIELENNNLNENELIQLLRDWILNHIFDEDRRYSKYLNEINVF
jgi:hemerythrin